MEKTEKTRKRGRNTFVFEGNFLCNGVVRGFRLQIVLLVDAHGLGNFESGAVLGAERVSARFRQQRLL